jgi:UDP-N-acetylmuramate dehydrogenase
MASWRAIIKNTLASSSSQILFDEPFINYTTFQIGGCAECFIVVNDINDLIKIIKFTKKENVPLFIIGNGSKLLISSQGLLGITIKLGPGFNYMSCSNNKIKVGAATFLNNLVQYAYSASLSGIEFLYGIPATFGGAVACNAGAFTQDISSYLLTITGLDNNGEQITLQRNDIKFDYRLCHLPSDIIITEGTIELIPEDKEFIQNNLDKFREQRKKTQPWGASVGSIFKNPFDSSGMQIPAGKLIDEAGLKGYKYKRVYISDKHANFIINKQHAHTLDVYELIQIIKSKVELKFNIILQEEVQILPKYREVKKWQDQKELSV